MTKRSIPLWVRKLMKNETTWSEFQNERKATVEQILESKVRNTFNTELWEVELES